MPGGVFFNGIYSDNVFFTCQNEQHLRKENSPRPEKIFLMIGHEEDPQGQRVFVERKSEFSDIGSEYHSRVNSQGQKCGSRSCKKLTPSPDYDRFQADYDKKKNELMSLKSAHGKLQKVLSEKGSELSHAVRKAEVYEREAKKLRYKLEEVRK